MKAVYSLDRFDIEAMTEGKAIRRFQSEFAMERPITRAKAKRGIVRGKIGADRRRGLLLVAKAG